MSSKCSFVWIFKLFCMSQKYVRVGRHDPTHEFMQVYKSTSVGHLSIMKMNSFTLKRKKTCLRSKYIQYGVSTIHNSILMQGNFRHNCTTVITFLCSKNGTASWITQYDLWQKEFPFDKWRANQLTMKIKVCTAVCSAWKTQYHSLTTLLIQITTLRRTNADISINLAITKCAVALILVLLRRNIIFKTRGTPVFTLYHIWCRCF